MYLILSIDGTSSFRRPRGRAYDFATSCHTTSQVLGSGFGQLSTQVDGRLQHKARRSRRVACLLCRPRRKKNFCPQKLETSCGKHPRQVSRSRLRWVGGPRKQSFSQFCQPSCETVTLSVCVQLTRVAAFQSGAPVLRTPSL